MYPVFVIDTSVIAYNITNCLKLTFNIDDPSSYASISRYTELAVRWVHLLGFLPVRPKHAVIIWAADSKPYWRTDFFPEYKGGRTLPPSTISHVLAYIDHFANPLKFHQFEADDVAALITKVFLKKERKTWDTLNLVTVDTDWMGMCGDRVFWFDTGGYAPRVRSTPEVKAWIERQQQFKKWEMPFDFRASDLWAYKACVGDKNDNIPGGNRYRHIIDLFSPVYDYCLWKRKDAVAKAEDSLNYVTSLEDVRALENGMLRMGMMPPIPPIMEKDLPNHLTSTLV